MNDVVKNIRTFLGSVRVATNTAKKSSETQEPDPSKPRKSLDRLDESLMMTDGSRESDYEDYSEFDAGSWYILEARCNITELLSILVLLYT